MFDLFEIVLQSGRLARAARSLSSQPAQPENQPWFDLFPSRGVTGSGCADSSHLVTARAAPGLPPPPGTALGLGTDTPGDRGLSGGSWGGPQDRAGDALPWHPLPRPHSTDRREFVVWKASQMQNQGSQVLIYTLSLFIPFLLRTRAIK